MRALAFMADFLAIAICRILGILAAWDELRTLRDEGISRRPYR